MVDGVDQGCLDLNQWRAAQSGALQDHVRFELITRESVGLGDLANAANSDRLDRALAAGVASQTVAELPSGLDTQLGGTWPDGAELSGGQWQRIALARGMMREAPLLLILDEPTSALDATTEHELFERYIEAARHARARGAVTLLVTHRFSTVSAADLIVVMDGGQVIEVGTHLELMRRNGQYAELYRLQASGYA